MAHRGVMGRVVFDDNGQGVPDLVVHVVDVYPIPDNDLGKATTDANGDFQLAYSPDDYQRWEQSRSPNIRIRIYGPVNRQLLDQTINSVTLDILDFTSPPIRLNRNNIGVQDAANDPASKAWLVTNATLNVSGDPVNLSEGNTFKSLIDGAALFPRITEVVDAAQSSINFMNLYFRIAADLKRLEKKDHLITKFNPAFNFQFPVLGQPVTGEKVQEIMKTKAASGLAVRVAVGDVALKTDDALEQVKKFFAGSSVQTRVADYGIEVVHARTVVVDGTRAIVLGSSFDQNYFSSTHLIRDARHRGSLLHDVAAEVTGPAVPQIDETFVTVWNQADSAAPPVTPVARFTGTGEVAMQVLRTMPGKRFPAPFPGAAPIEHGETSNLEAYQRAIARAEDFIYIEDQYFTNSAIVDALICRMNQDNAKKLQLIMVLNINADDFPGYARKQIRNIKLIQKSIEDHEKRFKVFTLWTTQFSTEPERVKKPFEIMNIYVHSKVAIIDDKWATIGTANLDGSGLNAIEISDITKAAILKRLPGALFILIDIILLGLALLLGPVALVIAAGILGAVGLIIAGVLLVLADDSGEIPALLKEAIKSIQATTQHANPLQATQPSRHVELNVVLYNGVAGLPSTEAIKKFREELWSEHLGISGAFPAKPAEGWVKLWTDRAQEKIDNVKAFALSVPGTTGPDKATAIEWKPETAAKRYLKAHGLDVDASNVRLTIRNKADVFNFLTGQWEKNKF